MFLFINVLKDEDGSFCIVCYIPGFTSFERDVLALPHYLIRQEIQGVCWATCHYLFEISVFVFTGFDFDS
jgi:hypothetical protein